MHSIAKLKWYKSIGVIADCMPKRASQWRLLTVTHLFIFFRSLAVDTIERVFVSMNNKLQYFFFLWKLDAIRKMSYLANTVKSCYSIKNRSWPVFLYTFSFLSILNWHINVCNTLWPTPSFGVLCDSEQWKYSILYASTYIQWWAKFLFFDCNDRCSTQSSITFAALHAR